MKPAEHDNKCRELVRMALEEDLGSEGDVTSQAVFSDEKGSFLLTAKDHGVLCGTEVFQEVCRQVDETIKAEFFCQDGQSIESQTVIAEISGPVVSVLTAERTAVNFLSFLSGIATSARRFADQASSTNAVILDTRKTLPGYRALSKYAVTCGGAENHRHGLYDMVLIKDNHIDAAGSITEAVRRVREIWGDRFAVEVETRNLDEVAQAIACKADRIMLDNMDAELMSRAVALVQGKAEVEASGNMTLQRIEEVGKTGVDFISVGEITHSVKAFDVSLRKKGGGT